MEGKGVLEKQRNAHLRWHGSNSSKGSKSSLVDALYDQGLSAKLREQTAFFFFLHGTSSVWMNVLRKDVRKSTDVLWAAPVSRCLMSQGPF